jgi:pantothenate kinase type III
MAAPTLNLSIQQGTAYKKRFIWRDKAKRPVAMTGFKARLQVRVDFGSPVLLDMSTENGKIVLGAIAGSIDLLVTKAEVATLSLPIGAIYDLKIIPPNPEDELTLLKGKVSIIKSVTVTTP